MEEWRSSTMSWSEKILNIPSPLVSLILTITIALPMVFPMGLPLKVSPMVNAGYDLIDELPEGSVVLFSYGISPVAVLDVGASARAMTYHSFKKGHKLIYVGPGVDNPMFVEQDIPSIAEELNKEYGVDWVHLGYYAGGEMGLSSILSDISSVYSADHYGTPLQDLPLMQTVKAAEDFDLHICITISADMPGILVRQVAGPYGMPIILGASGVTATIATPYYPTQIMGILTSVRGGAEYELLNKKPGPAIAGMDSISLSHAYLIILMVLANIITYSKRREEKGER